MDLIDLAILALRLALVLVLYAFLAMVVRTAARSISRSRPQAPTAPPASADAQAAPPEPPARYAEGRGMLRLMVLAPGASDLTPGAVIEVGNQARLGRAANVDIVVRDPTVSAEHARLTRLNGHWQVTDLGSTNGTRVNDHVIDEATLAPGDDLALGNVHLRVMER